MFLLPLPTMSLLPHLGWTMLHTPPAAPGAAGVLHRAAQCFTLLLHTVPFLHLALGLAQGGARVFLRLHPEILVKGLGMYLAWNLTIRERMTILRHHYRFAVGALGVRLALAVATRGVTLWQHQAGPDYFEVRLNDSNGFYMEGEFALTYLMNGQPLHSLAFSFAPGGVLGVPGDRAIAIGASQGTAGAAGLARSAAKANGEVAPADLLMIVLRSLATALEVPVLAAVPCRGQIARIVQEDPERFHATYDGFWESHGGVRHQGWYLLPLAAPEKPIHLVARPHRRRALRKRALKHTIFQSALDTLSRLGLAARPSTAS